MLGISISYVLGGNRRDIVHMQPPEQIDLRPSMLQDGTTRYIDPSTKELKFGIKEDLAMNARTVSVLDALATLCVSATTSQVFAIAFQLDAQHKKISITISGNADKYIWTKMQALSSRTESGGQSPPIPTQQMHRVDKWWGGRGRFTGKLLQLRQDNPEGIEQTLCEAVIAPGAALRILGGLHKDPRQQYTLEEWENVFRDSRWANENVMIVLADRDGF
ncbi:hypothetical protein HOY82DRAFT_534894 [Tuber indicum]|nr:hypothetical protein HOY82DRAFT_534894 [Tuber indicum]